jgi:SAM-dependent methyltransferase
MIESMIRTYMKFNEVSPSKNDFANWEVFKTKEFLNGGHEFKKGIYQKSVDFNYNHEKYFCFIQDYFPNLDIKDFENKSVLDLGCFTGGRLIRWVEKFKFKNGYRIDINPIFKTAGDYYIKHKKPELEDKIDFFTGVGEVLPFDDESVDFIFSFDVFEHVQDVEKVVKECKRVLKKDGLLLVAFPQFFQPLESHLGFVSKMPAVHWFFNGKDIAKVYYKIIKERGPEAQWYNLDSADLKDWEKLPSLNGMTIKRFTKIVNDNYLEVLYKGKRPIFSDGRAAKKYFIFKVLKILSFIPAQIPILNEIFLSKVNWIIKKI